MKIKNVSVEGSLKKNSVIKNIGITLRAWFKRYPSAWLLFPLYLILRIISPFVTTLIPSFAIRSISAGNVRNFVILIVIALLVFWIMNGASNILGTFVQVQRTYTRLGHFTSLFYHKTVTTDYENIEPQKKQKLLGKASNAINGNFVGVEKVMTETTELAVILFGILSYGTAVLVLDWRILLVTLAMFVEDVALRTYAIKYSDAHREESSEIWRKKNYIKQKSFNVSAGKDIRIYQLGKWFNSLFVGIIKARAKFEKKQQLVWFYPTLSGMFFNFARNILAYAILIKKVLDGSMDIATFTLYLGLLEGFTNWIYTLSQRFNDLRRASHEFNDLHDYLNLPERNKTGENGVKGGADRGVEGDDKIKTGGETEVAVKTDSETRNAQPPAITFRDVSFAYPDVEKSTINNLSFEIKAGEKIALVGNNGAGKTTVVKLLTGLYHQTSGDILVNGKTIDQIGLENYQDNISVLFQDTNPMAFTVLENVSSAEEAETNKERMWKSLETAGLKEKIESLPQKEETFITQNFSPDGILLSGGETQKLLFAKAIYKNGNFLILDEPTSALDPIAESKIYEEYNNLAEGKTAVFISHRLASTKFCDRIMFLENGRIEEFGSHEELMKKGGKYKEMFDIQSQYYRDENKAEEE
ncbi:MAG: ABC transporter ATP-binding protein/permease [Treponema sp.]|nr:ABC transporter ATP-binding protein/permease [Treponema sp.]